MLQLSYKNDFSIWDLLIRQGLVNNTVAISQSQMARIFYPVINHSNRCLLHEFSRNGHMIALQQIFLKAGSVYFNKEKKQFPFFRDFTGFSPLDYAYQKKNSAIFNYLLQKMIELQAGYESQHLVTHLINRAI